jgi:Cu-processing system ATP-binding protein
MNSGPVIIELDHATKFFGPTRALHDVTLQVKRGEALALVGYNGAGKSTAARLIAGVLEPTEGAVRVMGHAPDSRALQCSVDISWLPQGASYSKALTPRDIVTFAARRKRIFIESVEDVLDTMGIGGAADWLIGMLPNPILKRLSLAVAFMGEPHVLLLDEPTECLDREGRQMFAELVRHRASHQTLLMTTPVLGALEQVVDNIVELDNGEITSQRRVHHDASSLVPPFRCDVEGCEDEEIHFAIHP